VLLILIAILMVAAITVVITVYNPERARVREAFISYVADLRAGRWESAARRVYPEDLHSLRVSAINKASTSAEFRRDLWSFLDEKDPAALRAVPTIKFFEFLMDRTFRTHPEVKDAISYGQLDYLSIRTLDDPATVDARIAVETPRGIEYFSMRVRMIQVDDFWFVRL
jgi:hypothetical protein